MSISCVLNRRSVRDFTGDTVSKEDVATLLRAGLYAPSAKNSQPWEFLVVQKRETLDALADICQYWKPLKKAPLAILVIVNPENYKGSAHEFFIQDCAACTQNILVAAEGLSLGGVWLGLYGEQERMQGVSELLGLPQDVFPFSLLAIGHPASHPHPHSSFDEDKIHYEKY